MREYMPGPHAQFLEDVYHVANIREYVEEHTEDTQLSLAYDACLAMLSAFRDKHIIIVTRYVINPSRRKRSRSPKAVRRGLNLALASRKTEGKDQKGTGGTALIPFLKQARDETGEPAVGEWTKRFLSRQVRKEGSGDFFLGKEDDGAPSEADDVEVKGLAGTWTMEDEMGGICHY
jgi:indoleamine 2,3-dioxygenase